MTDHDGRCAIQEGRAEDLPWMDEGGIQDAEGNQVPIQYPVFPIQRHHSKGLLGQVGGILEQLVDLLRGIAFAARLGLFDDREGEIEGERVHTD